MNKTPSRITPRRSNRACLCVGHPDHADNTYHVDCCDGTIASQGIGVITSLRYLFDKGVVDCSKNINCLTVVGRC